MEKNEILKIIRKYVYKDGDILVMYSNRTPSKIADEILALQLIAQPSQPEQRPTAEEILASKRLLIKDGVEWIPLIQALKAMEEYRNQGIPEVTDEEIAYEVVSRFITRTSHPKSKIYLQREKQAFIEGAKWMRDKMR